MTPKELLIKLEAEAEGSEIGKARYEGALAIHECYLDKQRRYYKTHADHNRKYHREYQRARYAKIHGKKEVDKAE